MRQAERSGEEHAPATLEEREAISCLALLVAVGTAGGPLSSVERAMLEEALSQTRVPVGVTVQSLLDGEYDVDVLLREVTSRRARDAAFGACLSMACSRRDPSPRALAVLERIERAWAVPRETSGLLGRLFHEAQDTVWPTRPVATADPARRTSRIDRDVLRYSVLSGALGLNPVLTASIVSDLAVLGLQAKMFSDVGRHWGDESPREMVNQVIAEIGVGTGARIGVNQVVRLVPGVGSAFAASSNFSSTRALGQVAKRYWQSGGHADPVVLGELFAKSRAEGRRTYERHKADVGSKFESHREVLEELDVAYAEERISLTDFERGVAELR